MFFSWIEREDIITFKFFESTLYIGITNLYIVVFWLKDFQKSFFWQNTWWSPTLVIQFYLSERKIRFFISYLIDFFWIFLPIQYEIHRGSQKSCFFKKWCKKNQVAPLILQFLIKIIPHNSIFQFMVNLFGLKMFFFQKSKKNHPNACFMSLYFVI